MSDARAMTTLWPVTAVQALAGRLLYCGWMRIVRDRLCGHGVRGVEDVSGFLREGWGLGGEGEEVNKWVWIDRGMLMGTLEGLLEGLLMGMLMGMLMGVLIGIHVDEYP